MLKETKN